MEIEAGDIFMPLIGKAIGGINFSDFAIDLGKLAAAVPEVVGEVREVRAPQVGGIHFHSSG